MKTINIAPLVVSKTDMLVVHEILDSIGIEFCEFVGRSGLVLSDADAVIFELHGGNNLILGKYWETFNSIIANGDPIEDH